jgi:hypothetical protein
MARFSKVWLIAPLCLIALGCGSDREKGMNKDKGFPRSEAPKMEKKKGEDPKTPDTKKTDVKTPDTN